MKIFNYSDEYDISEDDEDYMYSYDPEDDIDTDNLINRNEKIVNDLWYYCHFNGINLLNKDILDITRLIKL